MKHLIKITIITFLLVLVSAGCAHQYKNVQGAEALKMVPEKPSDYVIQPGDQLDIKFFYNPELNETVIVRPDGKISLQLVDEIQAAGRTPAGLDDDLTGKYSSELRKPEITIIVKSFSAHRVYVGGEVNQQGFVDLSAGMSPLQAVIEAGGLKETADIKSVLLIRKGPENEPVPVRVNLNDSILGNDPRPSVQLQPLDVVYVPKTFIAEANKFVEQYIENLLLFRGVSMGFSYRLDNKDSE